MTRRPLQRTMMAVGVCGPLLFAFRSSTAEPVARPAPVADAGTPRSSSSSGSTPLLEIKRTGSFHGHEISTRAAGKWWALVVTGEKAALSETRVRVSTVRDEVTDSDTGPMTGKMLSVSGPEPMLLLRGQLPFLKSGPVATASTKRFENAGSGQSDGEMFELTLGKQRSRLQFGSPGEPSEGAVTLIGANGQRQMLYKEVEGGTLQWAGDLDGDGKLDLLIDGHTEHYNKGDLMLYLSSLAGPGELVKQAAIFSTTGC